MEWLEAILKSAKVTDGVLDVGAAVDAIKKEIPNHFVAKTDYNAKTKELQTANETIKTLKKTIRTMGHCRILSRNTRH